MMSSALIFLLFASVLIQGAFSDSCSNIQGVIQPNEVYTTTPTTYYWDCCKDSCSWPGRTPDITKPVNACARDGFTPLGDNEMSNCDGGPSASCTNMQPWQDPVDPNTMFIFSSFTNGHEFCCSCFELFDSDSPLLAGKRIITQITNCGEPGEFFEHQFNLKIPMSGEGRKMPGCTKQWGDVVDWGDQWGGVERVEDCDQLYENGISLYFGCLFRFETLKAESPIFKYRRVQCPTVLSDVSGCARTDDECWPPLEGEISPERPIYEYPDRDPLHWEDFPGCVPTDSTTAFPTSSTTTEGVQPPPAPLSTTSSTTTEGVQPPPAPLSTTSSTAPPAYTATSGTGECITHAGHDPKTPLDCVECGVDPIPTDYGTYVCDEEDTYAPCYKSQAECFTGFKHIESPEPILLGPGCWASETYNSLDPDCKQCPENPTYTNNLLWVCEKLNYATCHPSQQECADAVV